MGPFSRDYGILNCTSIPGYNFLQCCCHLSITAIIVSKLKLWCNRLVHYKYDINMLRHHVRKGTRLSPFLVFCHCAGGDLGMRLGMSSYSSIQGSHISPLPNHPFSMSISQVPVLAVFSSSVTSLHYPIWELSHGSPITIFSVHVYMYFLIDWLWQGMNYRVHKCQRIRLLAVIQSRQEASHW